MTIMLFGLGVILLLGLVVLVFSSFLVVELARNLRSVRRSDSRRKNFHNESEQGEDKYNDGPEAND